MKKKIILAIIIIILIAGVGAGCYFLGTKNQVKCKEEPKVEEKESKEEEPTEETPVEEEKEPEKEETPKKKVNRLVEPALPTHVCGNSVNFQFEKKSLTAKELGDDYKLDFIASELERFLPSNLDYDALEDGKSVKLNFNVMEMAKKYFDITPSMQKKIEEGFGFPGSFQYKNGKSYYALAPYGCEGGDDDGGYAVLNNKKYDGETLIMRYYYYYKDNEVREVDDDADFYAIYYKNKGDKNPLFDESKTEYDNITLHYDELDEYELYFDTSNGNMKFIKMVYLKK